MNGKGAVVAARQVQRASELVRRAAGVRHPLQPASPGADIGNQAVQHLFRAGVIQARLPVGVPTDPLEEEADRAADVVMRAPSDLVQRKCACGAEAGAAGECSDCMQKRQTGEMPILRRRAAGGGGLSEAPAIVHRVLGSAGRPLDHATRAFMEARFGRDFGNVRIHTDQRAAQSAEAIDALAYTVGNNVVFGRAQYAPDSSSGRRLLAHELTHVVQQGFGKQRGGLQRDDKPSVPAGKPGSFPDIDATVQQSAQGSALIGETAGTPGTASASLPLGPILQRAPRGSSSGGKGAGGKSAGGDVFDEPAGGCGLCYGDPELNIIGPREAGNAAHKVIQNIMFGDYGIRNELPLGDGRIDLAIVRPGSKPGSKKIEIGEIKPANTRGIDDGIDQIEERLRAAELLPEYSDEKPKPLRYPVRQPIRFETRAPVCIEQPQPGFCFSQDMAVAGPVKGLYLYFCEPSYSQLLAGGCRCKCGEELKDKEPKDKEPKKEAGPGNTLPEQLLKLGGELALMLAAAGLLNFALGIAGTMASMAAFVMSPLVALAALVLGILGIVYFWDKLKWLGSKIAGLAQWVWGKFTWILDETQKLGIKLREAISWVRETIESLAEKLRAGAEWAADKVAAGARWLGGKIASGAEAVWDWLFGSDPEPMAPIVDIPVTEDTTHCAMVAHEDTIVKISADLLFPFNEWKLKTEADDALKEAAAKIVPMLQKDDRILIEGYTDNIGSDEYNQHLSEQRAGAVASWFVEHGAVPMSRIQIEGYGKTRAQYNDPEGRKKDRRVEIRVPKHGSVEKVCW
jgi:outer membrane protein OmpA-like peptidoglycan-associated protein